MEDRRANLLLDGDGVGIHRSIAQNQNGSLHPRLPQLLRLQNGGHSEKAGLIFQKPGHLNGSVAVGIRLDYRHNAVASPAADRAEVFFNRIQINFHIGTVNHNIRSKCFFPGILPQRGRNVNHEIFSSPEITAPSSAL